MLTFPLSTNPEDIFTVVIFDILYNGKQQWNTLGFWTLSISDTNNIPLVQGVPLVAGLELLKGYANIPFDLKFTTLVEPTRDNLANLFLEVTEK